MYTFHGDLRLADLATILTNVLIISVTTVFITALEHSIISSLCLARVGAQHVAHVLLAGVSGSFSWGSPVFPPPTDWPVSYEVK